MDDTYELQHESLDLHGKLALKAKLSHTVTGMKALFLKIGDPFFAKEGKGAVLRIKITEPLHHSTFGRDKDKVEAMKK